MSTANSDKEVTPILDFLQQPAESVPSGSARFAGQMASWSPMHIRIFRPDAPEKKRRLTFSEGDLVAVQLSRSDERLDAELRSRRGHRIRLSASPEDPAVLEGLPVYETPGPVIPFDDLQHLLQAAVFLGARIATHGAKGTLAPPTRDWVPARLPDEEQTFGLWEATVTDDLVRVSSAGPVDRLKKRLIWWSVLFMAVLGIVAGILGLNVPGAFMAIGLLSAIGVAFYGLLVYRINQHGTFELTAQLKRSLESDHDDADDPEVIAGSLQLQAGSEMVIEELGEIERFEAEYTGRGRARRCALVIVRKDRSRERFDELLAGGVGSLDKLVAWLNRVLLRREAE